MRKFALTIAAILVMGSAFGQVWSYDWHGACRKVAYHDTKLAGDGLFLLGARDGLASPVDLDPTIGVDIFGQLGQFFVTKLDTSGNYQWSFDVNGQGMDITDFVVTEDGEVVICGTSDSTYLDLDPSSNRAGFYGNQARGTFIAFYNSTGGYLGHIEYPGATIFIRELALGVGKSLYYTGAFLGQTDFDFTSGIDSDSSSTYAAFVSKMDMQNSQYKWTRVIGRSTAFLEVSPWTLEANSSELILGGSFVGDQIDLNPWGNGYFLQNNSIPPHARCSFVSRMDTNGVFVNAISISAQLEDVTITDASFADDGSFSVVTECTGDNDSLIIEANGSFAGIRSTADYWHLIARFDQTNNLSWSKSLYSNYVLDIRKIFETNSLVYVSGHFYDSIFEVSGSIRQLLQTAEPSAEPSIIIAYANNGNNLGWIVDRPINFAPGNFADARRTGLAADNQGKLFHSVVLRGNPDCEFDVDPGPGVASTNATDSLNYQGNSYIVRLNLDGFVNTQNPHSPAQVLVYPNPTTQALRIDSESPFSKVTLQDLQGRVLLSQTFDAVQNQTLDLSAISRGVYLLTIEGEMGRVTSKVVKQ